MARRIVSSSPQKNLEGRVFGRLTVIRKDGVDQRRKTLWLCKCECGKEVSSIGPNLLRGVKRSCGCLAVEGLVARSTTHGMTNTREYHIWYSIKARCFHKSHKHFDSYGGRGITMCDAWRTSFEKFLADMGRCPSQKHSIDRFPDKNGNYEPGNCRWATQSQQCRNKRDNRMIEFRGETRTLVEWSEKVGLTSACLCERLNRGWSIEEALTTAKIRQVY